MRTFPGFLKSIADVKFKSTKKTNKYTFLEQNLKFKVRSFGLHLNKGFGGKQAACSIDVEATRLSQCCYYSFGSEASLESKD